MDSRLKIAIANLAIALAIVIATNLIVITSDWASILLYATFITNMIVCCMALGSWLWDQRK